MRNPRQLFGEVAQQYDAARPNYPDALIEDVVRYAGPVTRAVEIGAGTGKATLAFAARGIALTCLEPDARMAALLATKCAPYPRVSVEVTPFESWIPAESYDLLIAAQSWHWVDPIRRWDLAYAMVRGGGALALFWHRYALADLEVQSKLSEVDRRFSIHDLGPSTTLYPASDFCGEVDVDEGWPAFDLRADPRFGDFVNRRYRRTLRLSVATYLDLLASFSAYRMLEAAERERLFDEVRAVFEAGTDAIELAVATDLFLGRTVGP